MAWESRVIAAAIPASPPSELPGAAGAWSRTFLLDPAAPSRDNEDDGGPPSERQLNESKF